MAVEERPSQLRGSLAVLGRRKWSVLAVIAVVVVGALAYAFLHPPVYVSKTEVLVRAISLVPTEPAAVTAVNIEVERRLATSAEVRERADAKVDRAGFAMGEVSVDVAPSDFALQFTATARAPAAAAGTANGFAESYLELRRRQALEDLAAARRPIQREIDANRRQLRALQGQLGAGQQEAQRAALQTELDSLLAEQSSLKQSLNRLVLPADLRVGQVLQPATPPRSPSSPDYPQIGAIALLAGLVLGVGLAFVRDRLDQRIRSTEELEALAGAPVLAVVPRADRPEHLGGAGPQPSGEVAETYEALSRKVLAIVSQSALKILMVTGSDGKEARAAVAANLGVALAKAQKRVVIVGSERWESRLGQLFGLPDDWASRQHEPSPSAADTGLQSLLARCWILPDNLFLLPLPGNIDVLGRDAWKELRVWLEELADIVVVDGAPVPQLVRDPGIGSITDGVLMAVDGERATRASVREARGQLDHLGVTTIGTVLVNDRHARAFGDHGRDAGQRAQDAERLAEQPETVAAEGNPWSVGPDELEAGDAQVLHFPRNHALAMPGQSDAQLVVVTGDRAKEGKAAVAAQLALVLATAGRHIALVDLDRRRPAQRRVLDLLEDAGFAKAASEGVSLERAMNRFTPVAAEHGQSGPERGSVEVLTAPLDTEEVIAGPTARLLDLVRERVDVVLINLPPMRRVDDALSLLPAVDALVVASRRNRVRKRLFNGLRPAIDGPTAASLGAVAEGSGTQIQEAEARRPLADRGADIWLAGLMAIGGAIALLLAFPDLKGVLQPAAALLFVGFVPGLAFVGLLRSMELPVKLIASIALSLVINAVAAQTLIWSDAWSPKAGFVAVALLSVFGFALQGLRRLRTSLDVRQGGRR